MSVAELQWASTSLVKQLRSQTQVFSPSRFLQRAIPPVVQEHPQGSLLPPGPPDNSTRGKSVPSLPEPRPLRPFGLRQRRNLILAPEPPRAVARLENVQAFCPPRQRIEGTAQRKSAFTSVKACPESRNTFETGKSPMRAAAIDRTRQGRQPHRGAFRYWHRPLAQSLDEMTLWDPGGDLLSHIQPVARSTPKPTAMSV